MGNQFIIDRVADAKYHGVVGGGKFRYRAVGGQTVADRAAHQAVAHLLVCVAGGQIGDIAVDAGYLQHTAHPGIRAGARRGQVHRLPLQLLHGRDPGCGWGIVLLDEGEQGHNAAEIPAGFIRPSGSARPRLIGKVRAGKAQLTGSLVHHQKVGGHPGGSLAADADVQILGQGRGQHRADDAGLGAGAAGRQPQVCGPLAPISLQRLIGRICRGLGVGRRRGAGGFWRRFTAPGKQRTGHDKGQR